MDILIVDLNNINLDKVNFDKNDLKAIISVTYTDWLKTFKQRKAFTKELVLF